MRRGAAKLSQSNSKQNFLEIQSVSRHLNKFVFLALVLGFLMPRAEAHFPWLIVNEDGKAALFFGESIAERSYKLPPTIAKAKINAWAKAKRSNVKTTTVESDEFIGLVSVEKVGDVRSLSTNVTYGIYNGNRLNYFARHLTGLRKKVGKPQAKAKLSAQVVDTDEGVDVYVYELGKPMEGIEVHLYCSEGHEEGTGKTDASGKISFTDKEVEDGLNGIMFGHTVKGDAGELNGEKFESTMYYFTLTFNDPEDK